MPASSSTPVTLAAGLALRSFIRSTPPALNSAMLDGNVRAVPTIFVLALAFFPLNDSTASSPVRNNVYPLVRDRNFTLPSVCP